MVPKKSCHIIYKIGERNNEKFVCEGIEGFVEVSSLKYEFCGVVNLNYLFKC